VKKYKGGIISLVLLVAIAGISYAQIATSCIPNTSSPWCFSGSAISTVDGVTNVGIGTVAPALQSGGTGLHIDAPSFSELKLTNSTTGATATDGTALVVSGSNFAVNNREAGELTLGTSNTVRLHIDSTGNVGIGVTDPGATLDVQSNSAALGIQIRGRATSDLGSLRFLNNAGSAELSRIEGEAGDKLSFSTGSAVTERMVIDSAGNVGIGMATPGAGLDISKSFTSGTGIASNILTTQTGNGATVFGSKIDVTGQSTGTFTAVLTSGLDVNVDGKFSSSKGMDTRLAVTTVGGATVRDYFGGKFVVTGAKAASTAINQTYYGVYGEVDNAGATGEGSIMYGLFGKATGVSTVYGLWASATGGSSNFGVFSSAGINHFNDEVGIGAGLTVPTGQLHVDQASLTGAKPVLLLDQGDIDDTFIDFVGTSAADGTRSISSSTATASAKFGAIRIEINGVTKWIRVYDSEN